MRLGIDFGTCFSSAAFMDGDTVTLVKDPTSLSFSIPSSVFVSPQQQVFVGKTADNRRFSDPGRYRHEIKRDLGKKQPLLLGEQPYLPEQLIASILDKIKRDADTLLHSSGQRMATGAVLTVPATYYDDKSELMRQAAVQAGFVAEEVTLLEEPVAAALYYAHKSKISEGETLLVYDLGGGTFDAALLQKRGEAFERLTAPTGLDHLGGIDFDRAIYNDLVKQYPDLRPLLQGERTDRVALMTRIQVREMCTNLKHQLSEENEAEFSFVVPETGAFVTYRLTRNAFNQMISSDIQQTISHCQQMFQQANVPAEHIGRILLVGGSCRIPLIQQMLRQQFNRPLIAASDLELVVCQGAALYADAHKIYTVSPTSGEADYATISAALQAVHSSDRLVVRAGTYHESIVVDRAVTIIGTDAADKIILESTTDIGIQVTAPTATISGITLRHNPASSPATWQHHGAIVVDKGHLTLENCVVEATGHGISVWGAESKATLCACHIRASMHANVAVNNGGQASLEVCHLTNNADAGVYVRGKGSTVSMQQCYVHDNDRVGISISAAGRGQIERCDIFANGKTGIQIRDAESSATITQSHIRNGEDKGIALWEKATATIETCAIFNNAHAGIFVSGAGSSASIKRCHLRHGRYTGIDIEHKGSATLEACHIYTNAGAGVRVKDEGSAAVIVNSQLYDGAYSGIVIQGNAQAELNNSQLLRNLGPGIRVSDPGSKASVNDCTIQGNAVGILVESLGEAILKDVTTQKNRTDIYIEPGSIMQPYSTTLANYHQLWRNPPQPEDVKLLSTLEEKGAATSTAYQGFNVEYTLTEHNGDITSIAISSDGNMLVSGSDDNTIKLWDLNDGELLDSIENNATILSVAIHPDGQVLASGDDDGNIMLWDLDDDGELLATLTDHTDSVRSVAFSPDGKVLASGDDDGNIMLWDLDDNGELLSTLTGHTDYIRSLAFSPDGKVLASGDDDGNIMLWDLDDDGELLATLTDHESWVYAVAFSPDGQLLASGSADGTVKLWDLDDQELLDTLDEDESTRKAIYAVAFSPDGGMLASAGGGGIIKLWGMSNNDLLDTLKDDNAVIAVSFSPDGRLISANNESIKIWESVTL